MTSPGKELQAVLRAHRWSQADLARKIGVAPRTVSQLCRDQQGITPWMAVRLGEVTGIEAGRWILWNFEYWVRQREGESDNGSATEVDSRSSAEGFAA